MHQSILMPPPPLRIAFLECDTPLANTRARYGGYGGVFAALLERAIMAAADTHQKQQPAPSLALSCFDVVGAQAYPALDDVDAIWVTGSHHNAFDNTAWICRLVGFVRHVVYAQRRVRIVGVCFGHQIVARALGATVARSPQGWEVGVTPVLLTPRGRELFARSALALHQMHRDDVLVCPEGVEPLAISPACAVHGVYVARCLMTLQGHPEFDSKIVREVAIRRHETGAIDDAIFEDAIARMDMPHDGVVVAQAFLRFLLE